jgi:hypothetical protein
MSKKCVLSFDKHATHVHETIRRTFKKKNTLKKKQLFYSSFNNLIYTTVHVHKLLKMQLCHQLTLQYYSFTLTKKIGQIS